MVVRNFCLARARAIAKRWRERAQRGEGFSSRHYRPRGDLCRSRRPGHADGSDPRAGRSRPRPARHRPKVQHRSLLEDQDIALKLANSTLSPEQERRYQKLNNDIIAEVKSLRLNQMCINSLVEQLYDINKRLVGYEGRLMRLAKSHGVAREDFLKDYRGSELDLRWLQPGVEAHCPHMAFPLDRSASMAHPDLRLCPKKHATFEK